MTERYEVIDECAATVADDGSADAPSVRQMCTWLSVSTSGFYDWRGRPLSATAARREDLKIKIEALFDYNDGTYGYRRIHAELVRGGERVGPELVGDLMRALGLVPCQPRPYKVTTIRGGHHPATQTWWTATSPPRRRERNSSEILRTCARGKGGST